MENYIILPTYDRPELFERFIKSHQEYSSEHSKVFAIVDETESKINEYLNIFKAYDVAYFICPGKQQFTVKTNFALEEINKLISSGQLNKPTHYSSHGDDVVLCQKDWDIKLMEACNGESFHIVYPNDGRRPDLPCHWTTTTEIVDVVGFIALPVVDHMFVDNFWKIVGDRLSTMKYMEDVHIKHLHWAWGDSVKDRSYQHSDSLYQSDERKWNKYLSDNMESMLQKIKEELNINV